MPLMAGRRSELQEDVQFRVSRELQKKPDISRRELAQAVGISVGGAHYVLNALVDKGFVKLANFSAAKDKRRYVHILTPKGLAEKTSITLRFLERKIAEYEALKAEINTLEEEMALGSNTGPVLKSRRDTEHMP